MLLITSSEKRHQILKKKDSSAIKVRSSSSFSFSFDTICMSHVTQQVNIKEFNPRENADIHFNKNVNIVDILHHIGDIVFFSPAVL